MKKLTLFFVVFVFFFNSIKAQDVKRENVARECVLYEIFTGVRCQNCPAVALGVARLLEEGKNVAVVAYHTNAWSTPDLYTTETNARANYYNVQGYPTVRTDGSICVEGGGPASYADPIYSNYLLPKYNQSISKTSPYEIELFVDYHSGTECKVSAEVNKVGDCSTNNLRFYMVMTESHIQRAWQGLSELNFVVRDMIPNQNGTDMTDDETQTFEEIIDLAGYDRTRCEIVAWVQNKSTKEVLQAVKFSMADMQIDYDARISNVCDVVNTSCSGLVSPCISFVNNGNENINSVLFAFSDDNANEVTTYLWEGNLAKGESADVVINDINFGSSTKLNIEAKEVNGKTDGYAVDNYYTVEFEPAYDVKGYVKLQLKTNSNPEDLTINLRDMSNGDIVDTYLYTDKNKIYKEDIYIPDVGCYRFEFISASGNGIGTGYFQLIDADNEIVYFCKQSSDIFKHSLNIDINSSVIVGVEEMGYDNVEIYPNPATSVINISAANMKNVSIYNVIGQLVYNIIAESDNIKINTDSWTNGMYYVNVETVDGNASLQKIIVNK